MAIWEPVLWGMAGGLGAEFVILFSLRHSHPNDFPHWVNSKVYYIVAAGMVVLGGVVALAHVRSGAELSPILAIQVGASAPLFFRKAKESLPQTPELPDPAKVN